MQFKVAILQINPEGADVDANTAKGEDYCRRAHVIGADFALFPEMWQIGYLPLEDPSPEAKAAWQSRAISRDDKYVRYFQDLARELEMAIAITYLEKWDGAPRNTVSIADRYGRIVLTYAKVHTCDFGHMESACTPGESFEVAELDTADGPFRVGAMICYDREAPESARCLMLNGAEIIITPNACTLRKAFIDQFQTRAFENAVGVAMANYAAPRCNGMSVAFDAEANLLVQAGAAEGLFMATFDLDAIRQHRSKTIWGNSFRRPHRYAALTEFRDLPEFKRNNAYQQPFEAQKR